MSKFSFVTDSWLETATEDEIRNVCKQMADELKKNKLYDFHNDSKNSILNKFTFNELHENQIKKINAARGKITTSLEKLKLEDFKIINSSCGSGSEKTKNDRRIFQWIETKYKDVEYAINFFHSEIDINSGNCHTQIGKIMFTKGYRLNRSYLTSPNEILKDFKGRYMSNKNSTALIFNSNNWINPIDYFSDSAKSHYPNLKKIMIDDINNDSEILTETVNAFVSFIKDEKNKNSSFTISFKEI